MSINYYKRNVALKSAPRVKTAGQVLELAQNPTPTMSNDKI